MYTTFFQMTALSILRQRAAHRHIAFDTLTSFYFINLYSANTLPSLLTIKYIYFRENIFTALKSIPFWRSNPQLDKFIANIPILFEHGA